MYKLKHLLIVLAAAAALSAIVPAVGLAGKWVINDHYKFTSDPYPSNFCGVDGTAVDTIVEHYSQDVSGASIDNVSFTSLFTATASGKSLESSANSTNRVNVIDNGDGTITFVGSNTGLVLQFKIPNGPVLKDASGKPLLGAGELSTTETYDADGNFISGTESWHGPHPFRDGVDICGPVIAYLS
jgi:hypothetical protein